MDEETGNDFDEKVVDAEILEVTAEGDIVHADDRTLTRPATVRAADDAVKQRAYLTYLFIPLIFLTVTLLGGLRLSGLDGSFIFLRPALFCLIFAAILMILFFRSGLLVIEGWFSENFDLTRNIANGVVLLSLYAAATQIFNSLVPEQGLAFWVIGFCFFWTLWNYMFADLEPAKLLRSLGGMLGLAFVAKYLLLAYLTAPAGESWLRSVIENPGREAFTWFLDLPQFAAGTGYIQFFTVILFLLGLYLLPRNSVSNDQIVRINSEDR